MGMTVADWWRVTDRAPNAMFMGDVDADGVVNNVDNCPAVPNPGQEDLDGDGIGAPPLGVAAEDPGGQLQIFWPGVAVDEAKGTVVAGRVHGWIGVAVLIGIDSLRGFGVEVIGQIAVLGATLSYAFAAIYGRRFKGMSPLIVATGMLCGSTLMMTPLAVFVDQPWNLSPSATSLMAIFGLAAISTSLAYIIYFKVLATAGATNLLLVTFLIPLSAILLGVMVLGEQLEWNAFVGMGLIFVGLIAIDGRLLSVADKVKHVA